MKQAYFFIIILLICSCQKKVPSSILSQDKMEKIMWDQTQADVFTEEFLSKDSTLNLQKENFKIQEKIFSKYNTDRKTFYKSYQFYITHEELMKPLLDTIVVRNGRKRDAERIKNILKPNNEQIKY